MFSEEKKLGVLRSDCANAKRTHKVRIVSYERLPFHDFLLSLPRFIISPWRRFDSSHLVSQLFFMVASSSRRLRAVKDNFFLKKKTKKFIINRQTFLLELSHD